MSEGCPAISHVGSERFDSFDIVCINIQARLGDDGDVFQLAGKITGQGFNENIGCPGIMLFIMASDSGRSKELASA